MMDVKDYLGLLLIACGLLVMTLSTLGLGEEIFRTDIPSAQKVFGVLIGLVAISVVLFIVGVHLRVSSIRRRHLY